MHLPTFLIFRGHVGTTFSKCFGGGWTLFIERAHESTDRFEFVFLVLNFFSMKKHTLKKCAIFEAGKREAFFCFVFFGKDPDFLGIKEVFVYIDPFFWAFVAGTLRAEDVGNSL